MTVAVEYGLPGLMHEAGVASVVVNAFWIPGILTMRQGYSIFALPVLLPIYQGPHWHECGRLKQLCCRGVCGASGSSAAALANEVLLLVMRCCMEAPVVSKQWMLQGYQVSPAPTLVVVQRF